MRTVVCGLLALLAAADLAGCRSKAHQMSRYPYFIEMLDRRWGIARDSFRTANPTVGYVAVLLKDLTGAIEAMQATYHGPNKEQGIAQLQEITRQFREDLSTQVEMRYGSVVLLPGVKAEEVGKTIEKAYQAYAKVRPLVKF